MNKRFVVYCVKQSSHSFPGPHHDAIRRSFCILLPHIEYVFNSWTLMRSVKQWKSPSLFWSDLKKDFQVVPIGSIASFRCLFVVQIQDDLRSRGAFFYFAIIKLSVSHNVYPLSIFKLGWDEWHIHLLNIVLKGPVPSWLQQSTSAALQSI